jgi:hypothetical protein
MFKYSRRCFHTTQEDRTNIILEIVAAIDYACQACNELVSMTLVGEGRSRPLRT